MRKYMAFFLALLLLLPFGACAFAEDGESVPAVPPELVGKWKGTGTPVGGGPSIDLTAFINADGSGAYTFNQSGYEESYPIRISSNSSSFSVDVPEVNQLGISKCEGTYRLENGVLYLEITTTFVNGRTYSYTAECRKDLGDDSGNF